MRLAISSLLFAALATQAEVYHLPVRVSVPTGATSARLVLHFKSIPAEKYWISLDSSTDLLTVTLVTPDGARVTRATANAGNGFAWAHYPHKVSDGSLDPGYSEPISFTRPGLAGDYVLEFTSTPLPKPAVVDAIVFKPGRHLRRNARAILPWFPTVRSGFSKCIDSIQGLRLDLSS